MSNFLVIIVGVTPEPATGESDAIGWQLHEKLRFFCVTLLYGDSISFSSYLQTQSRFCVMQDSGKSVVIMTVVSILWLGVNNVCSFISIVYMHHQTHNKAVPTQIYVYKEHQIHRI